MRCCLLFKGWSCFYDIGEASGISCVGSVVGGITSLKKAVSAASVSRLSRCGRILQTGRHNSLVELHRKMCTTPRTLLGAVVSIREVVPGNICTYAVPKRVVGYLQRSHLLFT